MKKNKHNISETSPPPSIYVGYKQAKIKISCLSMQKKVPNATSKILSTLKTFRKSNQWLTSLSDVLSDSSTRPTPNTTFVSDVHSLSSGKKQKRRGQGQKKVSNNNTHQPSLYT